MLRNDLATNVPRPSSMDAEQWISQQQGWAKVVNKSGGNLAKGDVVIPDTTAITVVAAAVASGAQTVADTLATENGFFRLVVTNSVAAVDAEDITVTGTDDNGNSISEDITCTTDANGEWISDNFYSTVTAVNYNSLNDTNATAKLAVTAIAVSAVKKPAATSDLTTVCGIMVQDVDGAETIADEAYAYMATRGIVDAKLDRADQNPGAILATSGSNAGQLAAPSSAAVGGVVAKLVDQNKAEEGGSQLLRVQLILA